MKNFIALGLLAVSLPCVALAADAGKKTTLGVDITGQLPMGTFGDVAGIGVGGLLRGEYMLNDKMSATGRAGYVFHLEKEMAGGAVKNSYSQIPILAGIKYALSGPLYLSGEAGFTMFAVTSEVKILGTTVSADASETDISLAGGVGYPVGPVDLRATLHIVDIGHMGDSMLLGVSAGFNFMSM